MCRFGLCLCIVAIIVILSRLSLTKKQKRRLDRRLVIPMRLLKIDGFCQKKLQILCADTRRSLFKARPGNVQTVVLLRDDVSAVRVLSEGKKSKRLELSSSCQEQIFVERFMSVSLSISRPAPRQIWSLQQRFKEHRLATGAVLHHNSDKNSQDVVLFVPGRGALMDSEDFLDDVEESGKTFAILYFRGHTYGNANEKHLECAFPGFCLDTAVEDVLGALEFFSGRRIRLVGYSLGGLIATLVMTRRAPLHVVDVVLISPLLSVKKYIEAHPILACLLLSVASPCLTTFRGHSIVKLPEIFSTAVAAQNSVCSGLRSDPHHPETNAVVTAGFASATSKALTELQIWSKPCCVPALLLESTSDSVVDAEHSAKVAAKIFTDLKRKNLPFSGHFILQGLLCADGAVSARILISNFWNER